MKGHILFLQPIFINKKHVSWYLKKQGKEREKKRQRLLLPTQVHHPKTYISSILVSEQTV
jgi:hypothetical protein